MSEETLELACKDYEVVVVDLDDTLTLATSLEEFLSFHLQRKYGVVGVLKVKLISILLRSLRILGLQSDVIFKIYANLLLLGEGLRDLEDSALLYVYDIIKKGRIRQSLLSLLRECHRNLKILVLATSNIDLIVSLISRYFGFHYFVSSEIECNFTCYLEKKDYRI